MAKQRPEEPKPKKTLLMSVAEFFKGIQSPFRSIKSPLENEKIRKYTDKVQSMDKKQGRKLLAGIVGGFLLVIYLILVHVYSDRFIDGTIINGIHFKEVRVTTVIDYFRNKRIRLILAMSAAGASPDEIMARGISYNMVHKYYNNPKLANTVMARFEKEMEEVNNAET